MCSDAVRSKLIIRQLGRQPYEPVWHAMQEFTDQRDANTVDELWILEHDPVFTQGQAGKEEHILAPGDIPVVKVDRGGQVTYHGPGQLVIYFLLDIRRRKIGVRQLVNSIEDAIIALMANHGVTASAKSDAPGVYVNDDKLCSLGLRIRKGCSFHGLALNVDMDLSPFARINPCGYAGIKMVQSKDLNGPHDVNDAGNQVTQIFSELLGYQYITEETGFAKPYVQAS